MADKTNQQRIYVETDYDNIILIDPNKIVVGDKIEDRLVDHEDLVFYANLESRVIPRTKLAVGEGFDSPVVNSLVASIQGKSEPFEKINFLMPKGKNGFDTSWSDQFTGKGSRQGLGANQTGERFELKDGTIRAFRNVKNYEDTQALGIKSIDINIKPNAGPGGYVPDVKISLVDVGGRTLFEQGENSIYSAFFNMPYPIFYLTIKGYYGKALRYTLYMTDFDSKFDEQTGNFNIEIKLTCNLLSLLQDTTLTYAKTAPKMYPITISTNNNSNNSSGGNNVSNNTNTQDYLGKQILKDVYRTYKAKRLIAQDFPELTIDEFINRVDDFETQIFDEIKKGDFVVLNDIDSFKNELDEIKNRNYEVLLSKYLDKTNFVSYNNEIYYQFKQTITLEKRNEIESAVLNETENSVIILKNNKTFGIGGSYKIGSQTFNNSEIPIKFGKDEIFIKFNQNNLTDDDFKKTYQTRYNKEPSSDELLQFKVNLLSQLVLVEKRLDPNTGNIIDTTPTFVKYGIVDPNLLTLVTGGFLDKINTYQQRLKAKQEEIELNISNQLSDRVVRPNGTIGFKPTIRNIFAIIMAGCDTFIRLMDRTHTEAWNKRNDPYRIKSIIPAEKSSGIDSKSVINYADGKLNEQNVVYPWPTYYLLERQQDGRDMFTIRYLGDPKYASKTFAFSYDIWPEISFTENFLDASVRRASSSQQNTYQNLQNIKNFTTVNALEFPFQNKPYEITTELTLFYELFERIYVLSYYSNILNDDFKPGNYQADTFISHLEGENIINAITENFVIQEKLKNTSFTYDNFVNYLKTLANNGTSQHWLNFERGIFNTSYLESLVENSFGLYSKKSINGYTLALENTDPLAPKFKNYVESKKKTNFRGLNVNNVEKISTFLDDVKVISRLRKNDYFENILSTNSLYEIVSYTKEDILTEKGSNTLISTKTDLVSYINSEPVSFGNYGTYYKNNTNRTSVTQYSNFMNTPFFINAIQKGVELEKNGNQNPYVSLGYLYTTSLNNGWANLPIFYDDQYNQIDFNLSQFVINSNLKEEQYCQILKTGALYHRYKKYVEEGIDIMGGVFENFNFKKNYDPISEDLQKTYKIKDYTGGSQNFISKDIKIDSVDTSKYVDILNIGFYPKVISDLHYYLTGKDLFTAYTENEFTEAYNSGLLKIGINTDASYFMPIGGDHNNNKRSIILNSYFSYLTFDKKTNIDGQNKIHIMLPSGGGIPLNQAKFEFFNNNKLVEEVLNNPKLYNGSVRSLWGQPNFGFFDIDVEDNSYYIDPEYDKLEFKVYEHFENYNKKILDKFEEVFLGFCKKNPKPEEVLILEDDIINPSYFSSGGITPLKNRKLFEQMLSVLSVNDASITLTNQQNADGLTIAKEQNTRAMSTFSDFVLNNDIILKIGNPTNYNRKLFTSLTTLTEFKNKEPITFSPYVLGTLPGDGFLVGPNSLQTSQTLSTINVEAWKTLKTYVYVPNSSYTNSGSTVTDFFIDMNIEFTKENIITCQELIYRYYNLKNDNENLNKTIFINYINEIITKNNETQKNVTNQIFKYLNTKLPNVSVNNTNTFNQGRVSGDVGKLSVYNQLQTYNNRWVAGSDLTTRTLFEDFIFINSACSDVGDQLQLDLDMVKKYLKMTQNMTIADLIGYMLNDDKTSLLYASPSYVNFYGIQEALNSGNPIPIDIPNSLFGTYTNVNYLDSRQKFIILYIGKTSEHPAMNDNRNVVYGDDSYDIRNQADSPIRVEQTVNTNFYKNNKVVAFNVDFGIRNQNVFKGISVGMGNKKQTLATFRVNENLAQGSAGESAGQQTQSLYSYYKSLSYNCKVTSLGNAMIQPTMYFNLKHVPLFYGPYQIIEVSHTITSEGFSTSFEGFRMPKYALPDVDSVSTFIKKNYLEKYKNEILKSNNEGRNQADVETILDPQNQDKEPKIAPEEECDKLTLPKYKNLPYVNINYENISIGDLVTKIKDVQTNKYVSSTILTLAISDLNILIDNKRYQFDENVTLRLDSVVSSINYNLFSLNANNLYADNPNLNSLICVSYNNGSIPLFSFQNVEQPIEIINNQLKNTGQIINDLSVSFNNVGSADTYSRAITSLIIAVKTKYIFTGSRTSSDIFNFIITNLNTGKLSTGLFETSVKLVNETTSKF